MFPREIVRTALDDLKLLEKEIKEKLTAAKQGGRIHLPLRLLDIEKR